MCALHPCWSRSTNPPTPPPTVSRPSSESAMTAPTRRASQSGTQQRKAQAAQLALGRHNSIASVSETDLLLQQEKIRRMTMATGNPASGGLHIKAEPRSRSRSSFDTPREQMAQHRLSLSQAQMLSRFSQLQHQQRMARRRTWTILPWTATKRLGHHLLLCLGSSSSSNSFTGTKSRTLRGCFAYGLGGPAGLHGRRTDERVRRHLRWAGHWTGQQHRARAAIGNVAVW